MPYVYSCLGGSGARSLEKSKRQIDGKSKPSGVGRFPRRQQIFEKGYICQTEV